MLYIWQKDEVAGDTMRPLYTKFKMGNLEEFEYKLDAENNGVVEYLRETARQVAKPTKDELKALIIEYRSKLNLVKKKFN